MSFENANIDLREFKKEFESSRGEVLRLVNDEKQDNLLTLCVDVGSSATKVFSFRSNKYYEIENKVVIDAPEDLNTLDIVGKKALIEDSLDVVFEKVSGEVGEPLREFLNKRVICGTLSAVVSPVPTKMSPFDPKHTQSEFYLNILTSILVEQLKNRTGGKDDIKLAILLPPYEHFNKKDIAINNLVGKYRVRHNLINVVTEFEIKRHNLMVLPESFTSFANICYNNSGTKTEIGVEFQDKLIICIDIGKNTTDISGMKDLKPLAYTFETFRYGTDYMLNILSNTISKEDGQRFNKDTYERAFTTGKLEDGNSFRDIKHVVIKSREEFADKFMAQFAEYLDTKNIQFRNVAGCVFIGGGSIGNNEFKSAAHIILERIHKFSPNTKGVFIENPRRSNLDGLINLLRNQQ